MTSHQRMYYRALALGFFLVFSGIVLAPRVPAAEVQADGTGHAQSSLRVWMSKPLEALAQREAVEMLTAIISGSGIGPGRGWFHPAESRYDWEWLCQRYDSDGDGTITRAEWTGPEELFDRLDRDRSSTIMKDDFDWSDDSPFIKQRQIAQQLIRQVDGSNTGEVTLEQWQAFFTRAASDGKSLDVEDLQAALFPPEPPQPPERPAVATLVLGIFDGEIGSIFEGPEIGEAAPDFTLPTHDGEREVTLSDFRGQKPVVLIFGSFT